jgi:hypothetical protein
MQQDRSAGNCKSQADRACGGIAGFIYADKWIKDAL